MNLAEQLLSALGEEKETKFEKKLNNVIERINATDFDPQTHNWMIKRAKELANDNPKVFLKGSAGNSFGVLKMMWNESKLSKGKEKLDVRSKETIARVKGK